MKLSDFKITDFYGFNQVEGQYSREFIKSNLCIKVEESNESVDVCIVKEKTNIEILQKYHQNKKINIVEVSEKEFVEFIGNILEESEKGEFNNNSSDENKFSLALVDEKSPVVNILNAVCLEALRMGASDIHIQPDEHKVFVKFRLDGILKIVKILDKSIYGNLVSRIKVMAGLNIMENRLPQDGRLSVLLENRNIDFRVSIVPVSYGQSVVLRLFNYKENRFKLEQLGFTESILKKITKTVKSSGGLILVTGPTGSGKTTTLHSILQTLDSEHLKIISIEDPVERLMSGVDQIQINEDIGLTFEAVLRKILRQDPDVILVGEIRDCETAQLAIRAALTGHLVLSTLHTNGSVAAINRLRNLGIDSYLIANVLKLCIAQRLVRKTCENCRGAGCRNCSETGFYGRTVVAEGFEISEEIKNMIILNKSESEIYSDLKRKSFETIKENGLKKVKENITEISELEREGIL